MGPLDAIRTGIGPVTGMKRQGYEVSIGDHGGQWIAVSYEAHGGDERAEDQSDGNCFRGANLLTVRLSTL
jgi:hypothetical protein